MHKKTFIPKQYRPDVPGSKLCPVSLSIDTKFSKKIPEPTILCLSASDDIVPENFFKDIDYSAITHLHYDELGISWDFSFFQHVLKIHTLNRVLIPTAIYHRHPGVSGNHRYFHKHAAFFEVLDIWDGNLIGQKRDHHHNFSKAYQGITSIKNANLISRRSVKYPRSFFIKGDLAMLKEKTPSSLVVKSCSNMRSTVVSEEIFQDWDQGNLNNLPTMFQEKINGKDIRVHVCEEIIWTLQIESKDCIDYRYASKGIIKYHKIQLPKYVRKFCKFIARFEKNRFIGIDLIMQEGIYYCLESNPGPGWSTYHHESKKMFSQTIYKQLLKK